ncbi:stalk domain-containing protein [Saccharibacillus deserti]|uniref:stalk domain-containing protein n=1 Tax=Saccharibacillus deserti TaxID=1634444 RepID=UPI0015534908|nr:stalk domain-containing protein [Saccharibacillus deserti]
MSTIKGIRRGWIRLAEAKDVMTVGNITMVPIRVVSEDLGYKVVWNKQRRIAIGEGSDRLVLTLKETSAEAGPVSVSLQQPPPASLQQIRFADGRLSVLLDGAYSPVSSVLTGPDRIMVDLPGTALGSGFVQGAFGTVQSRFDRNAGAGRGQRRSFLAVQPFAAFGPDRDRSGAASRLQNL